VPCPRLYSSVRLFLVLHLYLEEGRTKKSLTEEEEEFYNNLVEHNILAKIKVYPNCQHGFTHDCFEEYDEVQSKIAWNDMSLFLKEHIF
jgi:dienelactone hydrolase